MAQTGDAEAGPEGKCVTIDFHPADLPKERIMDDGQLIERDAIFDVIVGETRAFLLRDLDAWAEFWLQDAAMRRLGALLGGLMDWQEGWDTSCSSMESIMRRFPDPNPDDAKAIIRDNWSFRIGADMAWVSFDQYGPGSQDLLVTVGLSHQLRVLEKCEGQWKIAMAGHGDSSLQYHPFPVIQIDEKARIIWMNDAAKVEIPNHPVLVKSGAHLRARTRSDDRLFRNALVTSQELTIMDRRPSLQNPHLKPEQPILLSGEVPDEHHVVWIAVRDGPILVSFNDDGADKRKLSEAQQIFGLSPGQIRLAECVLKGMDMPSAAEELGVKVSTANTHLRRLFEKTGVKSQSALVSVVLGIVPPG